jgi:hypothetical protein
VGVHVKVFVMCRGVWMCGFLQCVVYLCVGVCMCGCMYVWVYVCVGFVTCGCACEGFCNVMGVCMCGFLQCVSFGNTCTVLVFTVFCLVCTAFFIVFLLV